MFKKKLFVTEEVNIEVAPTNVDQTAAVLTYSGPNGKTNSRWLLIDDAMELMFRLYDITDVEEAEDIIVEYTLEPNRVWPPEPAEVENKVANYPKVTVRMAPDVKDWLYSKAKTNQRSATEELHFILQAERQRVTVWEGI